MLATQGRAEGRACRTVALQLAYPRPGAVLEMCFTENISPHGVRIVTHHLCSPREQLSLFSESGKFRSRAEVVYCVPKDERNSYAVGLKLIEPTGEWVVNPSPE